MIATSTFEKYYREQRKEIPNEYEIIYKAFAGYEVEIDGTKKSLVNCNEEYFSSHASEIIVNVREEAYKEYLSCENKFNENVYAYLVNHYRSKSDLDLKACIKDFLKEVNEHVFTLSKSTTNARRSRAGTGFQAIVELVLTGAGIRLDSQAMLGNTYLRDGAPTKSLDFVAPSAVEFKHKRNSCQPLSLKTTLRERWSQVGEERNRINAEKIYLLTLDENIAENKFNDMDENHIYVYTTSSLVQDYKEKGITPSNLKSFETLICDLNDIQSRCEENTITNKEIFEAVIGALEKRKQYHSEHKFICDKIDDQIRSLYEKKGQT